MPTHRGGRYHAQTVFPWAQSYVEMEVARSIGFGNCVVVLFDLNLGWDRCSACQLYVLFINHIRKDRTIYLEGETGVERRDYILLKKVHPHRPPGHSTG